MSRWAWPQVDTAGAAEEWIDAVVHRPLAQMIVRRLVSTSITPNQVTGLACLLGVVSGLVLFLGVDQPALRVAAGALLFSAVVFDCADGQLARARQASSRTGDMLDGLADVAVSVAFVSAATYVAAADGNDVRIWILGAVALASQGAQCALFDFAKRVYLSRAGRRPLPSASDLAEVDAAAVRARQERRWGDAFLLWFYRRYFDAQQAFRARLRGITSGESKIRAWTWLGLGIHLALLYTAAAASALWPPALPVCFIIFCTVQNALLVALLV
jgi:phosphatidylglycerophosphate synthase